VSTMTTAPNASPPTAPARRREHRDRITAALARLHDAVAARPAFGHHTARSTVSLGDGLQCVSVEQSWLIASDLPPALGGERRAPTPSQLVQAALGACLAMGYQLRAAECAIELTAVRVTIESDAELRAMLRRDTAVPPGFTTIRYHVEIESPAAPDEIEALVEAADHLSPVLADLTRPLTVERTVSVVPPQEER
jgi:uncharacterized OsmC-like protein